VATRTRATTSGTGLARFRPVTITGWANSSSALSRTLTFTRASLRPQPQPALTASKRGPGGGKFTFPNLWSVSSNVELENTWAIGGRPDVLLYADGGYTQAKLNGQVNFTYPDFVGGGVAQNLTLSVPDTMDGFFVGGGGEMKVADHIALRLEYRYAKCSGETSAASATSTLIIPGFASTQTAEVRARLDEQIQSVRAAVVLKLGEP
jgi:opacity protein-like surface antigen